MVIAVVALGEGLRGYDPPHLKKKL